MNHLPTGFQAPATMNTPLPAPRTAAGVLPLSWRLLPGLAAAPALPLASALLFPHLAPALGLDPASSTATITVAAVAGLAVATLWLQVQLLGPLRRVLAQAQQLCGGQARSTPCPGRRDELGQLGLALQQAGVVQQALLRGLDGGPAVPAPQPSRSVLRSQAGATVIPFDRNYHFHH